MTIETKVTEEKIEAARKAVKMLGGAASCARKIKELTGKEVTRSRVQKWMVNGIGAPWHPILHCLTGIPLCELDPDIYPTYLFGSEVQHDTREVI